MSKTFTKLAFCLLFWLLMFCLLFVFIVKTGWAFTYEGELDPGVFTKWEFVDVTILSSMKAMVVVQNPDREATVQRVQMTISVNRTLLSYRYFKKGNIYNYKLNVKKDRYERRKYTDRERQACMRCHAGLISELPI